MGRPPVRVVAFFVAAALLFGAGKFAIGAESPIGKPAPDFKLIDPSSAQVALADLHGAKAVVVVFLGTECPLARQYAPRLKQLCRDYVAKGVKFVGIDANSQDSPQEVAAFAGEYDLPFPVATDPNNKTADAFGALRTPEVFLLDAKRVIRYHGRIDDQRAVGVQKPKPTRHDLAVAIDEVLAGKPVSQSDLPAVGCFIGRVTRPEGEQVTYARDVAKILQSRCVECHRPGEIAPFTLTTYEAAAAWGETIREVIEQKRMPPWFASPEHGQFSNDARLSEDEKRTIFQWVAAGCPQGNPSDEPPPRVFLEGWNIPQPDLVLKMSDKPFKVPAEGVVDYKHFTIDPGFTEDKWVTASEVRPGNPAVVHHVLVFLKPPGEQYEVLRGSLLAAYAPGSPPRQAKAGMAKRIPAGSKIVLQVHYTPNGKPQEDISVLGLKFCDAKDVDQRIESGWAVNFLFTIPAGDSNYKVNSQHRFDEDRILLSLTPHMHMRGKSFRYEAVYPDHRREVLLDVPRWDFNWQLDYELAEPKLMPKGTVLRCEAHYDNSTSNPSNPDPAKSVRFGEQTWDEMMIGWFTSATLPGAARAVANATGGGQ